MRFRDTVRRLVARGEVDDLDRGTARLHGSAIEDEERVLSAESLRAQIDTRHQDLPKAVSRRRAAQ